MIWSRVLWKKEDVLKLEWSGSLSWKMEGCGGGEWN
jgi:hypothetical protein